MAKHRESEYKSHERSFDLLLLQILHVLKKCLMFFKNYNVNSVSKIKKKKYKLIFWRLAVVNVRVRFGQTVIEPLAL